MPYSPDLSVPNFFLFPQFKIILKGQQVMSAKEVVAKVTNTDIGIEKRFPGMLPKALQMLGKVCHCPKELL
jgi:hypothetical protein